MFTLNLKMFAAVSKAVAKEETRYCLGGVFVHDTEKHRVYAATDGHRLFIKREALTSDMGTLPVRNDEKGKPMRGIILKGNLPLARLIKRYGGVAECQRIDDNGFYCKHMGDPFVMQEIDGTYPDYERVIPEGTDKDAKWIGLNIKYAAEVCAFLGVIALPEPITYGESDPCLWEADDGDTKAVLMPMRI